MKIKKKLKVATKANKDVYTKTQAENDQLEFYRLKEQRKMIDKREKELKERLDSYMSKALTPDKKGHFLFTVLDEEGNKIHLQKQARKKVVLNEEEALEFLRENGHDEAIIEKTVIAPEVTEDQIIDELPDSYLDTKIVVDQSVLESLVKEEKISMDDFEKLCTIQVTYAMTYIPDERLEKE